MSDRKADGPGTGSMLQLVSKAIAKAIDIAGQERMQYAERTELFARTALFAMRDPTEPMIAAGIGIGGWSTWYQIEGEFRASAGEVWRAMIGEADATPRP